MVNTISSSKTIKGIKESTIAQSEKNDCTVHAIATAFDFDYDTAHAFVKNNYNRRNRDGVSTYKWHGKNDKFSDDAEVINGKTINKIEYDPVKIKSSICYQKETWYQSRRSYTTDVEIRLYIKRGKKYNRMSVGQFIKKYPKGTFILSVRSHTFTIKDGVVYGNQQDGKQLRTIVEKAWEIK